MEDDRKGSLVTLQWDRKRGREEEKEVRGGETGGREREGDREVRGRETGGREREGDREVRGRETRKTHKNIGKSNNTRKDTLIGHSAMGQEERQEEGREGSEDKKDTRRHAHWSLYNGTGRETGGRKRGK